MRDDQHRGVFPVVVVLAHPVDRDPRFPQHRGDLGQRARLVHQRHAQVIGGGCLRQRGNRLRQAGGGLTEDRYADAARDVADIGNHRAGGRAFAGPGATQHDLVHRIAFQHHHVGAAFQLPKRRGRGHKAGRHALFQPAPGHAGDAQQLDPIAHVTGGADVVDGQAADALKLHRVKGDTGAKGGGGQKRQLVPGVDAAHVQFGIRLEVAQLVGLFEDGSIRQARAFHPGQDIVAGAVHDAHDAGDFIPGQPLDQRFDHGNAASDGGLVADHAALGFGQFRQRLAMHGQHRLVGGDHVLAGVQRGLGRGLGGAVRSAHELDEDIHIVTRGQHDGIVFPGIAGKRDAPVLVAVARRHGRDRDVLAGAGLQQGGFAPDDLDQSGPDSAQTRNAQPNRVAHAHISCCGIPARP